MIAYLKGQFTYKSPTYILLENTGTGYKISISLQTFAAIQNLNEGKILIHQIIREDAHLLFGFFEEKEKQLFTYLIGVSGVGPSTAILALSAMTTEELESAILNGDEHTIRSIKGIGGKTAGRIIIDVQDKLKKAGLEQTEISGVSKNTIRDEALTALLSLGFAKPAAEKAISKVLHDNQDSVEQLIKAALKVL